MTRDGDLLERGGDDEITGLEHVLFGFDPLLCDRAMIDLVEGDVDGAWVRYERGLACYEEGGYLDHAAAAREMWEQAAAS